jgi:sugar phosphate isomerase/epimerase
MHDRISLNALCFPGAGLAEMADHWRALKPRRISFPAPLVDGNLPLAKQLIAEDGRRFECMTHLFNAGRQLGPDEAAWADERARLSRIIKQAAELGGRGIYMLTGGRGEISWEDAAACFSAIIAPCLPEAKAAGVQLMIEPTSAFYAHGHICHSLRDCLTLAEMAGIGVCIDIFACWTEAGLDESLTRAAPLCGLVQVSDYVYGDRALPSRAVPGDGNIPLQRIFERLLSAGYQGAFDLELIGPRIDAEGRREAARRGADRVGEMLSALGA